MSLGPARLDDNVIVIVIVTSCAGLGWLGAPWESLRLPPPFPVLPCPGTNLEDVFFNVIQPVTLSVCGNDIIRRRRVLLAFAGVPHYIFEESPTVLLRSVPYVIED